MADYLKVARLYLLLLALVTLGRWLQSVFHVPYDKGHHVFSIVTLTAFSALYYGAFSRKWRRYSLMRAVGLGFTLGVISQLVVLLSTAASYGLGLETYFNNPRALNVNEPVPFVSAMGNRLGGLLGNSIFAGIGAALGWAMGALLPED